jgi:CAAX protease family protein
MRNRAAARDDTTQRRIPMEISQPPADAAIGVSRSLADTVAEEVEIPQYSVLAIAMIWLAAAVPMAVLAWLVAPALAGWFGGDGTVPMLQALVIAITGGLMWQFVLVAALVVREQRTLRWSTIRQALWLRSPRSPGSARVGGRLWLLVIPLVLAYGAIAELVPAIAAPADRDLALFLQSDVGQGFMSGNWLWFGLLLVMFIFNTALGEELLFRGFLLPRMGSAFGRGDWFANGVLFAVYHLHVPWAIPEALLADVFLVAYPSRRYRSSLMGIAVHSGQSVVLAAVLLALVLA